MNRVDPLTHYFKIVQCDDCGAEFKKVEEFEDHQPDCPGERTSKTANEAIDNAVNW